MVRIAAIFGVILLLGVGANASAASPLDSIQREVDELRADVFRSEAEIAALDNRVEETTKDIIRIYQDIEAQEAALTAHRRLVNARIQEVYKNYDYLVLSMILDARTFGDLWARFSFLSRINRADNELMAANKFRADRIKALKIELVNKKRLQLELRRQKQDEYAAMREAYLAKQAVLQERIEAVRAQQAAMTSLQTQTFSR